VPVVLVVLVVLARVAFAQAPGEMPNAPAPAPVAPDAVPVMADRWAVGLAIGSLGLQPRTSGADNTSFSVLELQGRYRIRPAIEVGLMLFGGGSSGNLATSGLFADFRYRFMADRPWNLYALAGLGVVAASDKTDPSGDQKGRGAFRVGAGIERRFRHLAVQAELRVVGVASNSSAQMQSFVITQGWLLESSKLGGGSLTLGASYYF